MFRQIIGSIRGSIRSISTSPKVCSSAQNLGSNLHKVNNLEKRFLVWTGKYKAITDVPDRVAGEVVEKARNRMRIRVANMMMGVTLIGCLVVSISGKRAHERGESVLKNNLEWHKSYMDQSSETAPAAEPKPSEAK